MVFYTTPVVRYFILEIGLKICSMDMVFLIMLLMIKMFILNKLTIKTLIWMIILIGLNMKGNLVMIGKMGLGLYTL